MLTRDFCNATHRRLLKHAAHKRCCLPLSHAGQRDSAVLQAPNKEAFLYQDRYAEWEAVHKCTAVTSTRDTFMEMFDNDDTLEYEPAQTAALVLTGGDEEAEEAALEVCCSHCCCALPLLYALSCMSPALQLQLKFCLLRLRKACTSSQDHSLPMRRHPALQDAFRCSLACVAMTLSPMCADRRARRQRSRRLCVIARTMCGQRCWYMTADTSPWLLCLNLVELSAPSP